MNQKRLLVFKKIKYGESDLILHGLTEIGERFVGMARGALKSKRRFGGGILEPGHLLSLTLEVHQKGELKIIKEASCIEAFELIKQDYDRLSAAYRILQLMEKSSFEGLAQGKGVFLLLYHTLNTLQTTVNIELLELHFKIRFLAYHGSLEMQNEGYQRFLNITIQNSAEVQVSPQEFKRLQTDIDFEMRTYLAH